MIEQCQWSLLSTLRQRVVNVCIGFGTILIAACTEQIPVTVETFPLPSPVIEKVHLRVGVIFSEDFRSYRRTIDENVWVYDLSLGAGSVDLVDQVLRAVFDDVVYVSKDQFPSDGNVLPPLVIEASLRAHVVGGEGVFAGLPKYTVNYGLRFFSADGKKLGSWTVSGHASDVRRAMRHAAAKLLLGLPEQEHVLAALVNSENRAEFPDNGVNVTFK